MADRRVSKERIPIIARNRIEAWTIIFLAAQRQVENLRYSRVKLCVTGEGLLALEVEPDRAVKTRRELANRLFHSGNRHVNILPGRL